MMDSPIVSTLPAGYQMDRHYGLIYERVPGRTDDLTRISGLHPREAAQLNSQGVFCFGQIALWRHREQVRFAEELQIPLARIVDEGWVSQARELCRERGLVSRGFASGNFRTLTALICALMLGMLLVWVLASQQNAPLAGILIAEVIQVRLPANALVQAVHVRPGDEVFTGQKLLTVENSTLLAARVRQQKSVREAELVVQRLEAQALLEQESRRAVLAAATVRVEQDLRRQGGGRAVARSGVTPMLFFSASAKSSATTSAKAAAGAPEPGSGLPGAGLPVAGQLSVNAAVSRGARILPAASAAVVADSVEKRTGQSEGVKSVPVAAVGESAGSEKLRAELARLETLQSTLTQHVEAAVGLTQARAVLLEATEELQRLLTSETVLEVEAPGYGLVGAVGASAGEQLKTGSTVVRILHPDRRSVIVQVPGSRLPELSVGETVAVHFPGARGYEGRVGMISPMTESAAGGVERGISVRIEPEGRVWPVIPVGCEVQVTSWK